MDATKDRDWEPREGPGDTYCAPACGGGCTRAQYDAAVAAADRLTETLGRGWKPRVWENLGWHYAAKLDLGDGVSLNVHTSSRPADGAWADLHGPGIRQHQGRGQPRLAVAEAVLSARAERDRLAGVVSKLEQYLDWLFSTEEPDS